MKVEIRNIILFICLIGFLIVGTGCRSVLPSEVKQTKMPWKSYEEVQREFDKIVPGQTTMAELKGLGYNITNTANIKILTYLDLIRIFMPNASITLSDLHTEVRKCIEAKDECHAYELDVEVVNKKRYGNVASDIFGFNKNTKITGWKFRALILIRNDKVVYKLCSGTPAIDMVERKKNPLGPFQELDDMLGGAVKSATKF